MDNIININRQFDVELVKQVEYQLGAISSVEKTIIFKIDSVGDNLGIFNKICGLMFNMCINNKYLIIGQAKHAQSSALLLFLNCQVRQVAPGSVGIIHLPVPNQQVDEKTFEKVTNSVFEFITRRTKMTENEIRSQNGMFLSPAEMLNYGIATEKITIIR